MSLENEDQMSPDKASENFHEAQKKPKISYTREFLLSLSNLDICKKLPSGFDESLLSEFEDALQSIQDRPRMPGSLPLQGFRRNEYGSSPNTRADSGNYFRGTYGRRESHSGQSDRDSDSQSSWDSDSGRHYSNQSRRPWQTHERDGLLGSGSFPRPSGYAAGISAPKTRANEQYQLRKSSEAYQPPRPYKAVPYSRRDTDSYNDETFGSVDSTSEDRADEENRRRASFELMRKEQQKALQDKQKLNPEKHKADGVSEIGELLEDSTEEPRLSGRNIELESSGAPVVNDDSEKSSFASYSPVSRPLFPPGFTNNILDKSAVLKSLIHPPLSEVAKPLTGGSLLHALINPIHNGNRDSLEWQLLQENSLLDGQLEDKTKQAPLVIKGENINFGPSSDVANNKLVMEDKLHHTSSHLDAHGTSGGPEIIELNAKVLEDTIVGESKGKHSTSILEKNFGGTSSSIGGGTDPAEHHDSKLEDTWIQSSKFAQWFFEEDAKPTDDITSGKPNYLLSLIVNSDKSRYHVSGLEADENYPRDFSHKSSEDTNKFAFDVPSSANGMPEQVYIGNKTEGIPDVLTCEDLEQSILSEYNVKTSNVQPLLPGWSTSSAKTELPRERIDDHASEHLLSLLQKGTDPGNVTRNSRVDVDFAGKLLVSEEHDIDHAVNEPKGEVGTKNVDNLEKTLTLEALFGTAFMKELQSVEAPVSVQRGSVGSAQIDAPEGDGVSFPTIDNKIFSLGIDQDGLKRSSHENRILTSDHRRQAKLGKGESWVGYDSQIESKQRSEVVSKHGGFDGVVDFQLPEEESLLSVGDQNHQILTFITTANSSKNDIFFSKAPLDIPEKLAATNAIIKDKQIMLGSESLPFTRAPHEQMEPNILYHNLQTQQSSSQFQPPQMTRARPLFHPLDSHHAHTTSQMKFMDSETIHNQESPASHHFLGNMIQPPFHHSSTGVAGFDATAHHPMLHQMQMSGNLPPHLLPDFTRGSPFYHPGNQATGFIEEMDPMRGFPFGPHQPNIGSLGMPIPSPDVNSRGNRDAFQRLIEMELRANSKQIHPLTAAGRNQGIYHHELDMGFRRR